jgi:hypothetical protein
MTTPFPQKTNDLHEQIVSSLCSNVLATGFHGCDQPRMKTGAVHAGLNEIKANPEYRWHREMRSEPQRCTAGRRRGANQELRPFHQVQARSIGVIPSGCSPVLVLTRGRERIQIGDNIATVIESSAKYVWEWKLPSSGHAEAIKKIDSDARIRFITNRLPCVRHSTALV